VLAFSDLDEFNGCVGLFSPLPGGITMTQQRQDIIQERLRQAHHSFNMALLSTTVCGVIGLLGIILTLNGKLSEGALMATGGLTPIGACLQCAKDANDRLDKIFEETSKDGERE
jgi:hypothetical protein